MIPSREVILRRVILAAVATAVLASSISCGYYSATGRTAGEIKRIAVPYLKNETSEPEIELQITQKIIEYLVNDNTLKVVSEEAADAVLEGSVVEYSNTPYAFNASLQAEQYRLAIALNVSLFKKKENSYIWEGKRINAQSDYYLESDSERNYEKAVEEVYNEIVESVLSSTVQEW